MVLQFGGTYNLILFPMVLQLGGTIYLFLFVLFDSTLMVFHVEPARNFFFQIVLEMFALSWARECPPL